MPLRFESLGYLWAVREGFPPMGSVERDDPPFVDALRKSHPFLARKRDRQITSWVVARLCYLTDSSLLTQGELFEHDSDEFGYKLKLMNSDKKTLAHGAIVVHVDRIYLSAVETGLDNYQELVVELLSDSVRDLSECEIRVREPETSSFRSYGWDGNALFE